MAEPGLPIVRLRRWYAYDSLRPVGCRAERGDVGA